MTAHFPGLAQAHKFKKSGGVKPALWIFKLNLLYISFTFFP
jgi:hypothetical protein